MLEITPSMLVLLSLAAGWLMLLPAPLLATHRQSAATATLAILLGTGFIQLVLREAAPTELLLTLIAAPLIAAPLMERARFAGLTAAAILGGVALTYGVLRDLAPLMPPITPLARLPLMVVAGLVMGLVGGSLLPLNPKRFRDGEAVWHLAPQALSLAGWTVLALALAAMAHLFAPNALGLSQLAAALVAAFVALLQARSYAAEDTLQKAGEGLVAGLLISLLVPLSPVAGAALGLLAGFFVGRSEALSIALKIEDPHHLLGALMLPSLVGFVLPAFTGGAALGSTLEWLGAALGLALALALILWPALMLTLGIALPPRLVRQGIRGR